MKPTTEPGSVPKPGLSVHLPPEVTRHIFKIARVMATKIVGRHYPELLDDATSMAAVRAWKAYEAKMNLATQAWAAKMGALEVLREKIGKNGKKTTLYHAESLDAMMVGGELRDMDTRSEMGEEDKTLTSFIKHGGDGELFNAILKLIPDKRRRLVVRRHYGNEEMTFRAIGQRLRPPVSESRVCQFHIGSIRGLREILAPFKDRYTSFDEFADLIMEASYCFRCKQLRSREEKPRGKHAICTFCEDARRVRRNQIERLRHQALKLTETKKKQRKRPNGKPVPRTHVCRICERSLPQISFHTRSERITGLASYCLECYSCVRGLGSIKKNESFADRIPFLRACWRVAWQEKLIEGKRRRPPNGRSTLLLTSVDEVRSFPGVLNNLKEKFCVVKTKQVYIPEELIVDWFTTSPTGFSTKKWAIRVKKHQTTIERWLHKLHAEAELFVHTEKERLRKR